MSVELNKLSHGFSHSLVDRLNRIDELSEEQVRVATGLELDEGDLLELAGLLQNLEELVDHIDRLGEAQAHVQVVL